MYRCCALLLVILLFASCKRRTMAGTEGNRGYTVHYATGFTVNRQEEYTEVRVRDPWDTTKYLQRYILIDRHRPVVGTFPDAVVVKVPLERMVVCASVHCAELEMLGVDTNIVGVCESKYIGLDFIRERLKTGEVVDIGEASSPDIEKLLMLSPEAMITSPLNNAPYGRVEKTGIPQIKCVDYMESTPLGRAEWIRFLALFTGGEAKADSIFNEVAGRYNNVKQIVSTIKDSPSVITEMRSGSMWYVPGGKSYIANILRDAGVDYAWYGDNHSGSIPLSFETVFEKSGRADFWLIKYNMPEDQTYATLKHEYDAYAHFAAYQNRRIFVCNLSEVPYYEETPVHPEYLLMDFVRIFHPDLLPEWTLRYYKPMQE